MTLCDETGDVDCTYMGKEHRHQKRIVGNLAAGPFVGKDEFGSEGCYFVFPDLSIRTPGLYRLVFTLIRLEPRRGCNVGRSFPIDSTVMTNVIKVVPPKQFVGMIASSQLARSLRDHGYSIQIRKGGDSRKARGGNRPRRKRPKDETSDESSDSCGRPRSKRSSRL